MAIPSFVDRVKLTVQAGNGGHGCASVHREKFKPLGGPDGVYFLQEFYILGINL